MAAQPEPATEQQDNPLRPEWYLARRSLPRFGFEKTKSDGFAQLYASIRNSGFNKVSRVAQ